MNEPLVVNLIKKSNYMPHFRNWQKMLFRLEPLQMNMTNKLIIIQYLQGDKIEFYIHRNNDFYLTKIIAVLYETKNHAFISSYQRLIKPLLFTKETSST